MATATEQQFNEIQEFDFNNLSLKNIKYMEKFIKEWKYTRKANSNRKVDAGTAAYRNLTEDEKNEFIENEFSNKTKYPEDKYKNVYLAFRKYYKDTHETDNLIDNDTQPPNNDAEKLLDNNSESESDFEVKPKVKSSKSENKDKTSKKKKNKKKNKKPTPEKYIIDSDENDSNSDSD